MNWTGFYLLYYMEFEQLIISRDGNFPVHK